MKIKSLKKVIASFMCAALVLVSAPQMSAFAALNDIPCLGGRYDKLLQEKIAYIENNPSDNTKYECHHLIAKAALNKWGAYVAEKHGKDDSNEFLVNDYYQRWAPSIIMEKADHEQTLSYYNPKTRTKLQNAQAIEYIDSQAKRIIEDGDLLGVIRDEIIIIQIIFGHKYDRALNEVCEYLKWLCIATNPESKVFTMRNPNCY